MPRRKQNKSVDLLAWVQNASPADILAKWRFEPIGSPFFVPGPACEAFKARIVELQLSPDWPALSKRVGWSRP